MSATYNNRIRRAAGVGIVAAVALLVAAQPPDPRRLFQRPIPAAAKANTPRTVTAMRAAQTGRAPHPLPRTLPASPRAGPRSAPRATATQVVRQCRALQRKRFAGTFSRHLRQMVSRSRGTLGCSRDKGDRVILHHLLHGVHRRRPLEGWPTRQAPTGYAQPRKCRPTPRACSGCPPARGRHVAGGAHDRLVAVCCKSWSSCLASPKSVILATVASGWWLVAGEESAEAIRN